VSLDKLKGAYVFGMKFKSLMRGSFVSEDKLHFKNFNEPLKNEVSLCRMRNAVERG